MGIDVQTHIKIHGKSETLKELQRRFKLIDEECIGMTIELSDTELTVDIANNRMWWFDRYGLRAIILGYNNKQMSDDYDGYAERCHNEWKHGDADWQAFCRLFCVSIEGTSWNDLNWDEIKEFAINENGEITKIERHHNESDEVPQKH